MLRTSLRAFPAARSISIFGRHRTLFLRAAVSTPNRFTSGPISSSRRLCIRPLGSLPSRHADPPLNGRDLGPRLRARRRGGRGSGARHARWQQSGAQRRADAPHRQTKRRAPALEVRADVHAGRGAWSSRTRRHPLQRTGFATSPRRAGVLPDAPRPVSTGSQGATIKIHLHPPTHGWCKGRYEVTVYLVRTQLCGPPIALRRSLSAPCLPAPGRHLPSAESTPAKPTSPSARRQPSRHHV